MPSWNLTQLFDRQSAKRLALRWLRRQLRGVAKRSPRARRAALKLMNAKRALIAAQGDVNACAHCARFSAAPHGTYDGGFCCGGEVSELFCATEVAALAMGGVRARHMKASSGPHAGCIFRGEVGCALEPGLRPVICVTHYCSEAQAELATRGDLDSLLSMSEGLRRDLEKLNSLP